MPNSPYEHHQDANGDHAAMRATDQQIQDAIDQIIGSITRDAAPPSDQPYGQPIDWQTYDTAYRILTTEQDRRRHQEAATRKCGL